MQVLPIENQRNTVLTPADGREAWRLRHTFIVILNLLCHRAEQESR
jgi:hypothetical protein